LELSGLPVEVGSLRHDCEVAYELTTPAKVTGRYDLLEIQL